MMLSLLTAGKGSVCRLSQLCADDCRMTTRESYQPMRTAAFKKGLIESFKMPKQMLWTPQMSVDAMP